MTTEDLIEEIIDLTIKTYKKVGKGSKEWLSISQHRDTIIDGVTFNCWKEYGVYKVAQWINDHGFEVKCNLEGYNSNIELNLDVNQQRDLNNKLYVLYKKWGQ